ncbi:MAG: CatB-related O-acetyltransferase [Sphingomonas sp.]
MASILRELRTRFDLLRWRRDQMHSLPLRAHFTQRHRVTVGLYSYGCFDRWRMPGPLSIGRYCSFGNSVRVVDSNHPIDGLTTHPLIYEARFGVIPADRIDAATLVIEDDVWVGHNSVILPGCKHIGRGAIVGAGSIVTRDVPAYTIVAGNPARTLRRRFPEDIAARLDATRWWERDMAGLAELERRWPGLVTHPTIALLDAYLAETGATGRAVSAASPS